MYSKILFNDDLSLIDSELRRKSLGIFRRPCLPSNEDTGSGEVGPTGWKMKFLAPQMLVSTLFSYAGTY